MPSVVVIGAGFSGIGAAVELRRAGWDDITLLERAPRAGGVWHHNTYPGATCDVPSHLYSYSWLPNAGWTHRYSPGPEIRGYLERAAREGGIWDAIRFGVEVEAAAWDDEAQGWRLRTSEGEREADVLIAATGQLSQPAIPRIEGLGSFAGPAFHSARWRHDLDLTGLRVACVGTGASAIQFVPRLAPIARHVTVFQRSAPWVIPKMDRAYRAWHASAFSRLPLTQRAGRAGVWGFYEAAVAGFVGHTSVLRPFELLGLAHLRRAVKDPELRRKLTPTDRIGCKRILLSDEWYPAMARDDVGVVTDAIDHVDETAIVDATGRRHEVDAIVFGTGFRSRDFVLPMTVTGRGGQTLQERWGDLPEAFYGMTIPGFPNFFLLYGPNTNHGTGSYVWMLESQLEHVHRALDPVLRGEAAAVEVREEALATFLRTLRARQGRTIWQSGCTSWYVDEQGRDANNWPSFNLEYRHRVRNNALSAYHRLPASRREPVGA